MLSKELIEELGVIMREEFGLAMSESDLESFAIRLVGFFSLLTKLNSSNKVR